MDNLDPLHEMRPDRQTPRRIRFAQVVMPRIADRKTDVMSPCERDRLLDILHTAHARRVRDESRAIAFTAWRRERIARVVGEEVGHY